MSLEETVVEQIARPGKTGPPDSGPGRGEETSLSVRRCAQQVAAPDSGLRPDCGPSGLAPSGTGELLTLGQDDERYLVPEI